MAEYIEREALIDAIEGINWYKYNDEGRLTQGGTSHDKMFLPYSAVEGTVKNIPAADVRPVVFCRDCKHKGWVQEPEHGKSVDYCRLIERCVDKQFFCAACERKTNCGADMREES